MFELKEQSIIELVKNFPKIRKDILYLINNCIDIELSRQNRLPGMSKEHLQNTGMCCTISNEILEILKNSYPDMQLKSGYFILDKHPRFSGKIYSMHSWLELNNKILDFTANQFNPFINKHIGEVFITNTSNPRYIRHKLEGYTDVGLDEDYILNWYIENL